MSPGQTGGVSNILMLSPLIIMNATVTPAVDYTWATVIIGQKVLTLSNSGSVVV